MANDFSTGKSIFVLAIVAGCFAILWPNVFYPMIQGSFTQKDVLSSTQGCCDVIFDTDVNAIKVMTEICEKILSKQVDFDKKLFFAFQQGKLTKDIVHRCQKTVSDSCGIDITQFLIEKVRLGKNYKQMLDEIRSLNSSLCLKQFGVSLGEIGLPRRIRIWGLNKPKHLRQERPPHLRPEFLHPALREKGRAIPQSNVVPKVNNVQEGRPGTPLPGIRPPMGGPGQVVPPPRGGGTMGIVMPMYTIGIIVFFLYTMMKLLFKKTDSSEAYENFSPDPLFLQKNGLKDNNFSNIQDISDDGSKLVITAITGLVEEVNRQIRSDQALHSQVEKQETGATNDTQLETPTEPTTGLNFAKKTEETEKASAVQENELTEVTKVAEKTEETETSKEPEEEIEVLDDTTDGKSIVKVLGMEMTESCEHGARWSRPPTPLSRPTTPQNIFISGSLPSKSQLLVSDSHTESVPDQDNAVVLTGKVTLSLIGLSENNAATPEAYKQDSDQEINLKNSETNGTDINSTSNEKKVDKKTNQVDPEDHHVNHKNEE